MSLSELLDGVKTDKSKKNKIAKVSAGFKVFQFVNGLILFSSLILISIQIQPAYSSFVNRSLLNHLITIILTYGLLRKKRWGWFLVFIFNTIGIGFLLVSLFSLQNDLARTTAQIGLVLTVIYTYVLWRYRDLYSK